MVFNMQRLLFLLGCFYILSFGFVSGIAWSNNFQCYKIDLYSCECFFIVAPTGVSYIFTTWIGYFASNSSWSLSLGLNYANEFHILSRLYYFFVLYNTFTLVFVVDTFDVIIQRIIVRVNSFLQCHWSILVFMITITMWPILPPLFLIRYFVGKCSGLDTLSFWIRCTSFNNK